MADLSPGVASALRPLVRRIVAPNPGLLTGTGTNTYLVGIDEVAVIDPGPDDEGHLDAIVGCGGDRIRWIAVTHSHPDHAAAAGALAERTGAELIGSVDEGFGIEATEFRLDALRTPGHTSDSVCWLLEEERMLFSGDTVIDGSTVVIAPPEGDMVAYLASLGRLAASGATALYPGHGPVLGDPAAVIAQYLAHREEREAAVLAALAAGEATPAQVVVRVYAEVDPVLHPAAERTVRAQLDKLLLEERIVRVVAAASGGESETYRVR